MYYNYLIIGGTARACGAQITRHFWAAYDLITRLLHLDAALRFNKNFQKKWGVTPPPARSVCPGT